MFIRKTRENGEILLTHPEGGSVELKFLDREARILSISAPEGDEERGVSLLAAAEAAAYREGMKTLIFDHLALQEDLTRICRAAGYELETKDPVVSVAIKDLISSTGVKKSMGLKFPKIEKYTFGELMIFQLEEVAEILMEHKFPVHMEELDECDDRISAVVYDEETYTPRAVLVASLMDSEVFVDLLCSFSLKKPEYALAACQSFIEGLVEEGIDEEYSVVTMLAMNEGVMLLLKRLLDKNVTITERTRVLRAKKAVKGQTAEFEDSEEEPEVPVTSGYQKNLNEKYIWNFGKK